MPIDIVDSSRRKIIADLLSYRRVLNNESQVCAAGKFGLKPADYALMEAYPLGRIKLAQVGSIESYIGFDPDTLLDFATGLARTEELLRQELAEEFYRSRNGNNTFKYKGHQRIQRGFLFYANSPYSNRAFSYLAINTDKLPHVQIHLDHVDADKLRADNKIPIIEKLTVLPFKALFYHR